MSSIWVSELIQVHLVKIKLTLSLLNSLLHFKWHLSYLNRVNVIAMYTYYLVPAKRGFHYSQFNLCREFCVSWIISTDPLIWFLWNTFFFSKTKMHLVQGIGVLSVNNQMSIHWHQTNFIVTRLFWIFRGIQLQE